MPSLMLLKLHHGKGDAKGFDMIRLITQLGSQSRTGGKMFGDHDVVALAKTVARAMAAI